MMRSIRQTVKDFLRPLYYSDALDRLRRAVDPIIIRHKFSAKAINAREEYLRLHLGCGNRRFPGYINIDSRKTGAADYVCDATSLPFPSNSVASIETYHMIEHLSRSALARGLDNWWEVLIPSGKLIIECPDFDKVVEEYLQGNEARLNSIFGRQRFPEDTHVYGWSYARLAKLLQAHGFGGIQRAEPQDYHRLEEPCLRVEAYKVSRHIVHTDPEAAWRERKDKRPETLTLAWREEHIHATILCELKDELLAGKRIISLGCGSGELEAILGREGCNITGLDRSNEALHVAQKHKGSERLDTIQFVRGSLANLPFRTASFDSGYMIQVLEHIDAVDVNRVFSEIRRVLGADGRLLVTVPNKTAYLDPGHVQFFTKGQLAELLDEQSFLVQCMEWETRKDKYRQHDMIKAIVGNRTGDRCQETRICAVGAYGMRYAQLGFHWDGQARAFEALGYTPLLLDVRRDTYENLRSKIIEYNPDILWLGLKECLPLLIQMREELREIDCRTVYWFCDLRDIDGRTGELPLKRPILDHPEEVVEVLDFMFLSNAGQITAYKEAYNLRNVHYMPQACTPQFMHRVPAPQDYQIGFAGSLGNDVILRGRTRLLRSLARRYKTRFGDDVRNTIAEFYAHCKIVLGADVIGESPEFHPQLYTSNRFFVALGCGAFYLCQWFPGIGELARDHRHLVWFRTREELLDLVDHYLERDEERQAIGRNAQELAHSKHTYVHRVQNMLDIIDGKTDEFYGFL
jgi:predicted SAM-dependent methyltransferase